MKTTSSRIWKTVGAAGLLSVAATGIIVARDERRRRSYTPGQIRARLHARLDGDSDDNDFDFADNAHQ